VNTFQIYVRGRENPFTVKCDSIETGEHTLRFVRNNSTVAEFLRCDVQAWMYAQ